MRYQPNFTDSGEANQVPHAIAEAFAESGKLLAKIVKYASASVKMLGK